MTFVGQMRFREDLHAQFDSSFVIPFHSFMEIIGSEWTLNIRRPFKPGENERIYLTRGSQVEDMTDTSLLGNEPLVDSRADVEVIRAFLESAPSGRPVKLNS